MADCLKKNLPVQDPVFCEDASGSILKDTAMYSWMSVRASGPNVLKDTTLCGNTVTVGDSTTNGYLNSNDKEGTQPSGQAEQDNQNDPTAVGPPLTSRRLVYDYNYRIVSVQGNPYGTTGVGYGLPFNDTYIPSWQCLYVNCQPVPFPPEALGPGGEVIVGTSQIEMHIKLRGTFTTISAGAGTPFPSLNPSGYCCIGAVVIQPNLNKYNQLNEFSLVNSFSSSTYPVANIATPINGPVSAQGLYSHPVANFCEFTPTGGAEDGVITLSAAFEKPAGWVNTDFYFLDLTFDAIIVVNDELDPN